MDYLFLTARQVLPRWSLLRWCVRVCPPLPTDMLIPWQGFGGFEYPHARARDIYPDHQYNAAVLSALLANISNVGSGSSGPIPQAQDSLVAGGPHLGTQYLDAEGIYNFSPSDGESAEIPGSGVAGSPYGAAPGINPRSPGTPVTQIDPNKAVVLGRINPLSSHPASMVGNQRATPVPAESPLVAVNDLGFQNSSKRKRSASPDGGREGKRPRRKPRQHSATQEQTQVGSIGIGLTQKVIANAVVFRWHRFLYPCPRAPISSRCYRECIK